MLIYNQPHDVYLYKIHAQLKLWKFNFPKSFCRNKQVARKISPSLDEMKFAHSVACVPYTWSVASSLAAFGLCRCSRGKERERPRRSIRTTARIINNKGIGTGDWWLHHDWRSIHHLFALLTKDWPDTSAVPPFRVSSLLSCFLSPIFSSPRRSTSLLSRSFLLSRLSLLSARPRTGDYLPRF